jgi:hypothetical protein
VGAEPWPHGAALRVRMALHTGASSPRSWTRPQVWTRLDHRRRHEVRDLLAAWASRRLGPEVVEVLQAAGVLTPVLPNAVHLSKQDPHLRHRDWLVRMDSGTCRTQHIDRLPTILRNADGTELTAPTERRPISASITSTCTRSSSASTRARSASEWATACSRKSGSAPGHPLMAPSWANEHGQAKPKSAGEGPMRSTTASNWRRSTFG